MRERGREGEREGGREGGRAEGRKREREGEGREGVSSQVELKTKKYTMQPC